MGLGKLFRAKSSFLQREEASQTGKSQTDKAQGAPSQNLDLRSPDGSCFDSIAESFATLNHSQVLAKHLYKIGVQRRWFPGPITQGSPRDSWSGGPATPESCVSRASSDYISAPAARRRRRESYSTMSPSTPTSSDSAKDWTMTRQSDGNLRWHTSSEIPDMSEDSDISMTSSLRSVNSSEGPSSPAPRGSPIPNQFFGQQVRKSNEASLVLRIGSSSQIEFYPQIQSTFVYAAKLLNMAVVMKIESHVVRSIVQSISDDSSNPRWDMPVDSGTRIQVLTDMTQIMRARKAQGAAFVVKEKCLLVWADDPEMIVSHAAALEQRLINVCLRQIKTKSSLCVS